MVEVIRKQGIGQSHSISSFCTIVEEKDKLQLALRLASFTIQRCDVFLMAVARNNYFLLSGTTNKHNFIQSSLKMNRVYKVIVSLRLEGLSSI